MTTRSSDKVRREMQLKRAYDKHREAIQDALKRSQIQHREIVTLSNGVKLYIAHTQTGYQVAGLCTASPLDLRKKNIGAADRLYLNGG